MGRITNAGKCHARGLEPCVSAFNHYSTRKYRSFDRHPYGSLLPSAIKSQSSCKFFLIFLQNNSDHPSKIFYKLLSSKVVFKIYSILLLGFASTLLLHFFWDYTVSEKSIPFFILFFLTSLVDCTSSGNDFLYTFS